MKSSRPWSAQWRSSKTSTVGAAVGDPLEERPPGGEQLLRAAVVASPRPSSAAAGLDPRRSSASGRYRRASAASFARATSARRTRRSGPGRGPSRRAPRRRGPRRRPATGPGASRSSSTRPSMYFSSSQASRLLPIPAIPRIETSRARRSRAVAWSSSLSRRSSSSRPTNGPRGGSSGRPAAAGDDPRRAPGRDRQLLAPELLVADAARRRSPMPRPNGRLADEDGPRLARTDWSRDAVFTRSPATMPWPSAPSATAASPVITAPRTAIDEPSGACIAPTASTRSSAARTARSASSSNATGRPPDGHDRVADELLDRAPVAPDPFAGQGEVPVEELAHRLRVAIVRQGGEPDEVGEQHAHDPPFRRAGVRAPATGRPGPRSAAGGRAGIRSRQRAAAAAAEPVAGLGRGAAHRTARGERTAARPTEPPTRPVLGAACLTDHPDPHPPDRREHTSRAGSAHRPAAPRSVSASVRRDDCAALGRRPAPEGGTARVDRPRIERRRDRLLGALLDQPYGLPEQPDLRPGGLDRDAGEAARRGDPDPRLATPTRCGVAGGPHDRRAVVEGRLVRPDDAQDHPALDRRGRDQPPVVGTGEQVEEVAVVGRSEDRLGAGRVGAPAHDPERQVRPRADRERGRPGAGPGHRRRAPARRRRHRCRRHRARRPG